MPDPHIVIVGAGRAGPIAADELARGGHPSTLLEVAATGRTDPAA